MSCFVRISHSNYDERAALVTVVCGKLWMEITLIGGTLNLNKEINNHPYTVVICGDITVYV